MRDEIVGTPSASASHTTFAPPSIFDVSTWSRHPAITRKVSSCDSGPRHS